MNPLLLSESAAPPARRAMPIDSWLAALRARVAPETRLLRDEPLAPRTTLRVGGPADVLAEPASEADLVTVLQSARDAGLPVFWLGRGSNLLVRDRGIRGLVIALVHPFFGRLDVRSPRLEVGAGARLKHVAVAARRHGLAGFEFLEGIPGGVGGALRMNAGAMGGWMFQRVERVRFMDRDGAIAEQEVAEIETSYRSCPLLRDRLALGAVLLGEPATPEAVAERMAQFSRERWDNQPAACSAGCIFKNPPHVPAGKLIDGLGLKGTRIGGAAVSDEHGNFIVNSDGATAADVLALIALIQDRVRTDCGLDLFPEVEVVGEE